MAALFEAADANVLGADVVEIVPDSTGVLTPFTAAHRDSPHRRPSFDTDSMKYENEIDETHVEYIDGKGLIPRGSYTRRLCGIHTSYYR